MTRVSVIIPAYNAASFVIEAIESVLAQSRSIHELFVVNDGSTDDTEKVLQPYLNRVRYVKQANQGVSAARNTGIELASGDYVLCLDADDKLDPQAIELLTEAVEQKPISSVAYGDVLSFDHRCQRRQRLLQKPHFAGSPPHPARQFYNCGGLAPGAFLVPLELARRVGGFDRRFSNSADVDFFMRCGCLAPFVYVPGVVLHYRLHECNMSLKVRTAIEERIDCRLALQDWCQARDLHPLDEMRNEALLLGDAAEMFYYTRQWRLLDVTLEIARERKAVDPRLQRIQARRRFPAWMFQLRDGLDHISSWMCNRAKRSAV
jgi:glycosyltransferase involved in cell wall biosynthesis